MKKSRVLMSTAALAGACIVGASLTGFASVDAAEMNAVDAVAAIQQVAPTAVSDVATASSDADTAIHASLPSGDTVSVLSDHRAGRTESSAGTGWFRFRR